MVMLFNLKSLVSALLSTAIDGVAVGTAEHFEITAQPKGIDVSSHQGNVNWSVVVANDSSLAYIKATEGTGRIRIRSSSTPLTFHFSLQEPILLFPVYWRHKGRSHSWRLPLRPSR